jgi:hypothetical protein
VDFIKSVLDVLGGRIASDCAHVGTVVLLAKETCPAKGEENDAMKRVNLTIHSSIITFHRKLSLIG